jgi:hypothetical protein
MQLRWYRRGHTLLALVRLAVVAFALQFTGATHTLCDAAEALWDTRAEHDDDCADGTDCPPGCPDCHCWMAGMAPSVVPSVGAPFDFGSTIEFAPLLQRLPASTFHDQVYRPPRRGAVG